MNDTNKKDTTMAVCIAGMHRSGTSMITRLMHMCGLYLGPDNDLLVPTEDNPEGYWERRSMMMINDAILAHFGGGWDFVPELPDDWHNDPGLVEARMVASRLLTVFEGHDAWGWKDPRNSLMLPFWRQLQPNVKTLVCLRNPLEVAASLHKRGYASRQFSMDLWLKYNTAVLVNTTPENRVVTHYESYFADAPRELARVCEMLGMQVEEKTIDQACTTANLSLRHSAANVQQLIQEDVPEAVLDLYMQLCAEAGPTYQGIFEAEAANSALPMPGGAKSEHGYGAAYKMVRMEQMVHDLSSRAAQADQNVQSLILQLTQKEQELALLRNKMGAYEAADFPAASGE